MPTQRSKNAQRQRRRQSGGRPAPRPRTVRRRAAQSMPRSISHQHPYKGKSDCATAWTTALTCMVRQTNLAYATPNAVWTNVSAGSMVMYIDPNHVQNGYHLRALDLAGTTVTANVSTTWLYAVPVSPDTSDSNLGRCTQMTCIQRYTGAPLYAKGRLTACYMPPPGETMDMNYLIAAAKNNPHARTYTMQDLAHGVTFTGRRYGDSADLYSSQDVDVGAAAPPAFNTYTNADARNFGWQVLILIYEGLDPTNAAISTTLRVHKELLCHPGTVLHAAATPPNNITAGSGVSFLNKAAEAVGTVGHAVLNGLADGATNAAAFLGGNFARGWAFSRGATTAMRSAPALMDAAPLALTML